MHFSIKHPSTTSSSLYFDTVYKKRRSTPSCTRLKRISIETGTTTTKATNSSTTTTGSDDHDNEQAPLLSREDVKLVELNCFYPATGMGLFDYYKDEARFTHGPFEWRIRAEPLPNAAVKLEKEWRDVLRGDTPRRTTDAAWAQIERAMAVHA